MLSPLSAPRKQTTIANVSLQTAAATSEREHRTLRQNATTMLLLDYQNVLIQSVLTERFSG